VADGSGPVADPPSASRTSASRTEAERDTRQQEARPTAGLLRHPLPLLESLVSDPLDPGYQAATDRKAAVDGGAASRGGRGRMLAYLTAGLVTVGGVLGIAAASTQQESAGADRVKAALLSDIHNAQARQDRLAAEQLALATQIRSAQSSLGAVGPLRTVQILEGQSALTAVRGPGLSVVIDGSAASSGAGAILDRDVQLLVNGLWSAGAEAVAIGGVRLRTTSAIRQAGGAILVDNRPVFWPLRIDAVGNPASLQVNFVSTTGFGRFQSFVSLYNIRFDVSPQSALTLPAGAAANLRYATGPSSVPSAAPTRSTASPPGVGRATATLTARS